MDLAATLSEHRTLWALLGLSVITVAIGLERLFVQWRFIERARALADTVGRCLARGAVDEGRSACERARTPLADVFLAGYERLGRAKREAVHGAVQRERIRVAGELKARLWVIGTIGALAPFVGLYGTVVGIMDAFGEIAGAEGAVFQKVAPGISAALVATAAGILVALEAVVVYNFFKQRLSSIATEMRLLADEFLEYLDDVGPGGGSKRAAKTAVDQSQDKPKGGPDGTRDAT